jgi:hypothetical protein
MNSNPALPPFAIIAAMTTFLLPAIPVGFFAGIH